MRFIMAGLVFCLDPGTALQVSLKAAFIEPHKKGRVVSCFVGWISSWGLVWGWVDTLHIRF